MPHVSEQARRNLTFWALTFIAVGLPLSLFLASVGTFVLAWSWLLEPNRLKRLKQFITAPIGWTTTSIYVLQLVGMLRSDDVLSGLDELRVTLPILLLPMMLFSMQLPSQKRVHDVLKMFILACVVGSLVGFVKYEGMTGVEVLNKRHLSVFISHIRFGLMLSFSFFILTYFLFRNGRLWSIPEKLISVCTMVWIFYFLVLMESATGFVAFAVLLAVSLVLAFLRIPSVKMRINVAIVAIAGLGASFFYVQAIVSNHFFQVPFEHETLTVRTQNGRMYAHQTDVPYRENGHRVWNFVCWEELRNEWPKRSSVPLDSADQRGQPIRYTLVRFLTSKGLKKDSAGVHLLTSADIQFIEKGFTNFRYTDPWGVSRRLDQALWEYEEYLYHGNANSSSILQRWVAMKVGLEIIREHPLLGVGTGGLKSSYANAYKANDHGLEPQYQIVSHNQFLTIGILFGLVGMTVFVTAIFYPLRWYGHDFLYVVFLTLIVVSFFSDNTFDRQSGVMLYAFFHALLIVRREFDTARMLSEKSL